MASPYINTMTSFSGADLVCTFANKVIGELQQISWAIQRQKAPVFTLGSPDPRSFSRGKRGIAGSMSFAVFDNDALIEALKSVWSDIAPKAMYSAAGNVAEANTERFANAFSLSGWNTAATNVLPGEGFGYSAPASGDASIAARTDAASDGSGDKVYVPAGFSVLRKDNIVYADTLPPFDVTLTFANEYGQSAFQKIYDVDILNEGSGVSVDSMVMEREMTWIARRMSPMIKGVYSRSENGILQGMSN